MKFWASEHTRDLLIFSYIFVLIWPLYTGSGTFQTEYFYPKISILEWITFEIGFTILCYIAYVHGKNFNSEVTQWR